MPSVVDMNVEVGDQFNNSNTLAAPCPVPTHIVTTPYFCFLRRISFGICMVFYNQVRLSGGVRIMRTWFNNLCSPWVYMARA